MDLIINMLTTYLKAIIIVLIDFSSAFFIVKYLSLKFPSLFTNRQRAIYLLFGTGFLLVAGIGKLGWQFETPSGTEPVDILNNGIFMSLSTLGTFFLFIDLCLHLKASSKS